MRHLAEGHVGVKPPRMTTQISGEVIPSPTDKPDNLAIGRPAAVLASVLGIAPWNATGDPRRASLFAHGLFAPVGNTVVLKGLG